MDRWQRIADSATKQSGARATPKIETYSGIAAALKALETSPQITICKLACMAPQDRAGIQRGGRILKEDRSISILAYLKITLRSSYRNPSKLTKSMYWWGRKAVSRDEIELLVGENFLPVTLGRRTLRTETALIVVFGIFAAWRSELLSSS